MPLAAQGHHKGGQAMVNQKLAAALLAENEGYFRCDVCLNALRGDGGHRPQATLCRFAGSRIQDVVLNAVT